MRDKFVSNRQCSDKLSKIELKSFSQILCSVIKFQTDEQTYAWNWECDLHSGNHNCRIRLNFESVGKRILGEKSS